jgi:glycerol kinase
VSFDHRQIYPQPGGSSMTPRRSGETRMPLATLLDKNKRGPAVSQHHQSARDDRRFRARDRPAAAQRHRLADAPRRADLRRAAARGHETAHRDRTGLKIDTYFSASKLTWLMQNHPDIARKLAEGEALIGTIDTYLIYRLTGGEVFATDHTNASRTLLFDIERLSWDEELCRLFRV